MRGKGDREREVRDERKRKRGKRRKERDEWNKDSMGGWERRKKRGVECTMYM